MSDDKLDGLICFNEDKTTVTLSVTSKVSITEENFVAFLYDFIKEFDPKSSFDDLGVEIEFQMFDSDEDGALH